MLSTQAFEVPAAQIAEASKGKSKRTAVAGAETSVLRKDMCWRCRAARGGQNAVGIKSYPGISWSNYSRFLDLHFKFEQPY